MMGVLFQYRSQKNAAESWKRHAVALMRAQEDAADRAAVEMPYIGWIYPPPIERRGGKWFAIIESGPSVPIVPLAKPKAGE